MSSEDELVEFTNRDGPFFSDAHALTYLFLEKFQYVSDTYGSIHYFEYLKYQAHLESLDQGQALRKMCKSLKKMCFDKPEVTSVSQLLLKVSF